MQIIDTTANTFLARQELLAERVEDARKLLQHGHMLMAINEMSVACPNVASFMLDVDCDLTVSDVQDAEGNLVSQDEAEALEALFHYRDEDDYTLYLSTTINVAEVVASWPYNN